MRVSPYDFSSYKQDIIDFKDEVTQILNYGKYQFKVLIEGTPTWVGKEGELAICYLTSPTAGFYEFRDYYYINSGWKFRVAVGAT